MPFLQRLKCKVNEHWKNNCFTVKESIILQIFSLRLKQKLKISFRLFNGKVLRLQNSDKYNFFLQYSKRNEHSQLKDLFSPHLPHISKHSSQYIKLSFCTYLYSNLAYALTCTTTLMLDFTQDLEETKIWECE